MTGLEMGLLGASMLPTLFGGGQVSVPSSMAKPTDPSKNILNDQGFVKDQFQLSGYNPQSQQEAMGLLGQLKDRALLQGPSQSAQYLQQANQLETQAQRDQLQNSLASNRATAEMNLATKGGRGTGSRERLANSAMLSGITGNQEINRQSSLNNLNTLANDESQKLGLLSSLPSQYMNMAQFDTGKKQFDISNSIGTATNAYNQQMQAWAGNQLARSQANSYNAANKGLLGGLF